MVQYFQYIKYDHNIDSLLDRRLTNLAIYFSGNVCYGLAMLAMGVFNTYFTVSQAIFHREKAFGKRVYNCAYIIRLAPTLHYYLYNCRFHCSI